MYSAKNTSVAFRAVFGSALSVSSTFGLDFELMASDSIAKSAPMGISIVAFIPRGIYRTFSPHRITPGRPPGGVRLSIDSGFEGEEGRRRQKFRELAILCENNLFAFLRDITASICESDGCCLAEGSLDATVRCSPTSPRDACSMVRHCSVRDCSLGESPMARSASDDVTTWPSAIASALACLDNALTAVVRQHLFHAARLARRALLLEGRCGVDNYCNILVLVICHVNRNGLLIGLL